MAVGIAPNSGDGPELIEGRYALGIAQGQNWQNQSLVAHPGNSAIGATQINPTAALVYISAVATTADSVKLPAAKKGMSKFVLNGTTTSANIFGFNATDKINGTVGSTAVAIAGNKAGYFFCPADGFWGFIVTP